MACSPVGRAPELPQAGITLSTELSSCETRAENEDT